MNIEIKANDLRRVFGTTVLWAAEDDSRPVLCGLHVIVTKDRLWSVAADPYCLAYDSADCTADEATEITLPRAAVDFALREIAALTKKQRVDVAVTITEAGISVAGAAFAYEPITQEFPNWRQVLPTANDATTRISLNVHFIARLQKVAKLTDSGAPFMGTFIFGGQLAPADIQVGDTFRAIVMPLRTPDEHKVAELPPQLAVKAAA